MGTIVMNFRLYCDQSLQGNVSDSKVAAKRLPLLYVPGPQQVANLLCLGQLSLLPSAGREMSSIKLSQCGVTVYCGHEWSGDGPLLCKTQCQLAVRGKWTWVVEAPIPPCR